MLALLWLYKILKCLLSVNTVEMAFNSTIWGPNHMLRNSCKQPHKTCSGRKSHIFQTVLRWQKMFLKKKKKSVKDAVTLAPSMFPMRSVWGAGFQYWGTGLSLRNSDLWWDSPRLRVGTSAGRRPATVGMFSLLSGPEQAALSHRPGLHVTAGQGLNSLFTALHKWLPLFYIISNACLPSA